MEAGQPSRTAYRAARHRAAHQVLDGGEIFTDPLAVRILGASESDLSAEPGGRGMRLFIAARSRFAEDALAGAVRRGVRQAVVLGAGLDTFGYRNPHPRLRVVEVDHPDTQAWKRERLDREVGNEVVFDYAQPLRRMTPAARDRAERAARVGEPCLTFFEPDQIAAELGLLGFREMEDLGPAALAARFFGRDDVPPETPGGHVLRALR